MDGAYHARHPANIFLTAAPSKENNTSKPNNECKPQQRPELSNDDFGQRQKNPRRALMCCDVFRFTRQTPAHAASLSGIHCSLTGGSYLFKYVVLVAWFFFS
ncbi:hypothetical protein HAX54_020810 [Datura stramonium]|uniref:Uncharacterized protein n=1 Tax=Datura stramonium TaxID=4076 RepID=A0ABS8S579_DATST|nr:hypothetical protein [Datura stramonium]